MKKLYELFALLVLSTVNIWAADGDVFTAKTVEGVKMTFKVISETNKTCQVGRGEYCVPAISQSYTGSITIPETVNNPSENKYSVVGIGLNAFYGCKISSVHIPNTISFMEVKAFEESSLESIDLADLSNSITTISEGLFKSCFKLKSIIIPNSVKTIGKDAFMGDDALQSVTLSENLKTIQLQAFYNCSSLENIILPDQITTIEISAFWGCSSLKSINIPNSLTEITDYVFLGCQSLESIVLPLSITKIGKSAFAGCHKLTDIVFPNTLSTIGENAFSGCSMLSEINIPDGVGELYFKFVGGGSHQFKGFILN